MSSSAALGHLLAELPPCGLRVATEGIASNPCGLDIVCICSNTAFAFVLEKSLTAACSTSDTAITLGVAQKACLEAVPWLATDTRQPEFIVMEVICIFFAVLAVVCRFWARSLVKAKLGWDDLLILFALFFTLAENTITALLLRFGLGKHLISLTTQELMTFGELFFSTQFVFATTITMTKLSILLFYHRIFPSRRMTRLCIIGCVLIIMWWFSSIMLVALSCFPIQFYWDKTISGGYCPFVINNVAYGVTASNLSTDLYVFFLPIPELWGLKMTTSKKLGLCFTFLVGAFVCVAGLVRIPFVMQLQVYDETWSVVPLGIWINLECNFGIVCACLPTMVPLFRNIIPTTSSFFSRLRSSLVSRSRSRKNSKGSSTYAGSDSDGSRGYTDLKNGSAIVVRSVDQSFTKKPGKSWYTTLGSEVGVDHDYDGDTVPLGQIQVRHDMDIEFGSKKSFKS